MSSSINNVLENVINNNMILYPFLFYFIILMILILSLYYVHSQQKKITALELVTPPVGYLGVDNPRDA